MVEAHLQRGEVDVRVTNFCISRSVVNNLKFTLQVSDGFCPEVSISPLLVQLGLQRHQLLLQLHPVLFQLATPLLHLPEAGLQALSLFLHLCLTLLQPGCRLLFRMQPGVGLVELRDG